MYMFWAMSIMFVILLTALCYVEDQRLNQECAYWKEHSQPMSEIIH
jgi:hypothetical protein